MTNPFTNPLAADLMTTLGDEARAAENAARAAEDKARSANMARGFIKAVFDERFSHARAIMFRGEVVGINIYFRDSESPSGVSCAASTGALSVEQAELLLEQAGRPSPLSPTEGLRTSR